MPSARRVSQLLALALTTFAAFAGCVLGVATADASAAGILPPNNPAADCDPLGANPQFSIQNLNGCRAKEGVGPLVLPSNWSALTSSQQLFVLINLERVNRGIAPVAGMSQALSQLASQGAAAGDDPAFPHGGFIGGGGIWFGGQSALAADYAWMYDDGPTGFDINEDCPRGSHSSSCWLHRDIILWKGTGGELVGGGGYVSASGSGSYAFEILSGYRTTGLTFTWTHELRYFAHAPGAEPLNPTARPAKAKKRHRKPASGSTGSQITIAVG